MILLCIFSMAISTNLFATLLLFCVSVKFELAIPFSTLRFAFLRVSLCGTVLTWGWSQGTGACNRPGHASLEVTSSAQDTDHNWSRHHHWAEACGWIVFFYSLAFKHACFHFINFINKCICVIAVFAQVKEVVKMNICCLFLSMCTLL